VRTECDHKDKTMISLTAISLALLLGLAASKAWNWAVVILSRKPQAIEAAAAR
jgi:hypothetical protein